MILRGVLSLAMQQGVTPASLQVCSWQYSMPPMLEVTDAVKLKEFKVTSSGNRYLIRRIRTQILVSYCLHLSVTTSYRGPRFIIP